MNARISKNMPAGIRMACFALVAWLASSCSPAEIPPPPSSELSSSASSKSTKSKASQEEEDEPADESADAEAATPTDSALQLGAQIGDEQMKKAVADCTKKGNFYSRINGGKCTSHKLAKMECTVDAIKQGLSAANRKTFESRLESSQYSGFVIDQCVECDGKNTEEDVCLKRDSGTVVTGVRIYFAKLNDTVVDVLFQTIEKKR